MSITIEQLLATLSIDAAEALVVSGRYVLIMRDPQPDDTGVPSDGTVYMRVVDLDGSPALPASIDFRVYIDQGAGEVLAFDGTSPVGPWAGPGSSFNQSTALDPYCFQEVTLDQSPGVFASEQVVTVHAELITGGGWGHAPWGHFPWGHSPTMPVADDVYYSFMAADTIAPNIVRAEALDTETIRVTFDDGMALGGAGTGLADDVAAWQPLSDVDPVGITRLNVDPDPGVNLSVTAVAVVADSSNTQFDLTVNWEMTPGCLYQLQCRNTVTDDAGNAIDTAVAQFSGFAPSHPQGRRFDYWSMFVPKKNRDEDKSQDLRRFINCLNEVMNLLLVDTDRLPDQFDLDLATVEQVEQMLWELGNPFDWAELQLTDIQRRKLAGFLIEIYKLKGTKQGIEAVILFLLGEVVEVVPATEGGWVLGEDELGEGGIAQLTCTNGETYNMGAAPLDLDLLIDALGVTFTFVADDFQTPAAATAQEVVDAINGRRYVPALSGYITRPQGSLAGGGAYIDGGGTPAIGSAGGAETYSLSGGETLELTVNGVAEVVTFHASDFSTAGAATAAEVAARISADVNGLEGYSDSGVVFFATTHIGADAEIIATGGTGLAALSIVASTTWSGTDAERVVIYSDTAGADASIQVTGGGAASILGFDSTVAAGTGGAVLAPSTQRLLYSFDIRTQTLLDSDTIAIIRKLADYMKPAHEHLIAVRPNPGLPWPDGWQLGIDELDESTELAL
jgi:phage tail-like protein